MSAHKVNPGSHVHFVFRGINSKNLRRPQAHLEINLQNDWAEVADLKIGAHEGQDPVPPLVALLLLGLTSAILHSHFSAKRPLK